MSLQIIDPTQYPGWDKLLLSSPDHSVFHTSAWARVLSESYGYSPHYFTILESGKLRALIPMMEVNSILTGKRGVSLPFTDYCEPLIDESSEFIDLFNGLIDYGKQRGWKYIELRGGERYLRTLIPLSSSSTPVSLACNSACISTENSPLTTEHHLTPQPATGNGSSSTHNSQATTHNKFSYVTYFGHTLDLSLTEAKLFTGFRDSTRRNIRKSIAEGVVVQICNSLDSVGEFYRLNALTRRLHGLPPQPRHFFQRVYDHILSKGLGFVTLAFHKNQAIAGSVFFHFGDKGIYKYGASDMKFQDLRANNLVMWEAIRWFRNNGYKTLCFGRTAVENEGLKQFKAGWGTQEYPINYFRYDPRKMEFSTHRSRNNAFGTRVFQRLPVPVLNLAGSVLYRHMG